MEAFLGLMTNTVEYAKESELLKNMVIILLQNSTEIIKCSVFILFILILLFVSPTVLKSNYSNSFEKDKFSRKNQKKFIEIEKNLLEDFITKEQLNRKILEENNEKERVKIENQNKISNTLSKFIVNKLCIEPKEEIGEKGEKEGVNLNTTIETNTTTTVEISSNANAMSIKETNEVKENKKCKNLNELNKSNNAGKINIEIQTDLISNSNKSNIQLLNTTSVSTTVNKNENEGGVLNEDFLIFTFLDFLEKKKSVSVVQEKKIENKPENESKIKILEINDEAKNNLNLNSGHMNPEVESASKIHDNEEKKRERKPSHKSSFNNFSFISNNNSNSTSINMNNLNLNLNNSMRFTPRNQNTDEKFSNANTRLNTSGNDTEMRRIMRKQRNESRKETKIQIPFYDSRNKKIVYITNKELTAFNLCLKKLKKGEYKTKEDVINDLEEGSISW